MRALFLALLSVGAEASALPNVLVTGASGRTGYLLYAQLKADKRVGEVLRTALGAAPPLSTCSAAE